MLKWPDARRVARAASRWAEEAARQDPNVLRVGYFGSYARGDWGVGSDLDLVILVERSDSPFERRSLKWDLTTLPVPADLLVYTRREWDRLIRRNPFGRALQREVVWLCRSEGE